MAPDSVLDEEGSTMVYGPIHKQRWIYASSKQLLDPAPDLWIRSVKAARLHADPAVQLHRAEPRQHRGTEGGAARACSRSSCRT